MNFSTEKFGGSSCGMGYSRTAEMKVSDSHSSSMIDSIDCELSVVPDWLGKKVCRLRRVNPKFCVNAKSWCKIERNHFKAGAAQAAAALSIK